MTYVGVVFLAATSNGDIGGCNFSSVVCKWSVRDRNTRGRSQITAGKVWESAATASRQNGRLEPRGPESWTMFI